MLINGESVAGSGGGTCQVSATLYNALLQLPEGISIIYRHTHVPSGATYARTAVDAAVGRSSPTSGTIKLNLEFQNTFDFPITIDCTVQTARCASPFARAKTKSELSSSNRTFQETNI
ncbi:MAG: VanW family protein [Christensenellales bacterium]